MDRFQSLECFVRVVETGSFTAAARDLGLGQPTVSKLVSALEERLGVRLLIRSTRRLAVTESGRTLYDRARGVLVELDEAEAGARGVAAELTGRLRVCAPVTFTRLHIAPRLGSFLSAHPKVNLEMILDDRFIDLLEENIDVAIRTGPLADSSQTARKLGSGERHVLARSDYFGKHGPPRTPADLARHEAILYARQSAGEERWQFRHRDDGRETIVRPTSRLRFSAAEGVRAAVLAGLGFAVASRWLFADELKRGEVVSLFPRWRLSAVDIWTVLPAGRMPSARARAFVRWLEGALADLAHPPAAR